MTVEAERRLEERIDRLERLLDAMADALMRKDTEQDGNWGFPPFPVDMQAIRDELMRSE
jgi:hypothetical protein